MQSLSLTFKRLKLKILSNPRLFYLYQGLKGFLLGIPVKNGYDPDPLYQIRTIVRPSPSKIIEPRLNLLIPTINKEGAYGGINTALQFLNSLSQYYSSIRLITLTKPTSETLKKYSEYEWVSLDEDSKASRQIVSLAQDQEQAIFVGSEDIFIGTIWYTALMAQQLVQWQSQQFNQNLMPIIYLIQDYEPGFYPWSSQYLLARSTYESHNPIIAVYNTHLLKEYFHRQNYKFDFEYSFEPSINKTLLQILPQFKNKKKKKQILIYGRPSTPRNAFNLITEGLKIWQKRYSLSSTWTILSAGEAHDDLILNDKQAIQALGKLSLEDYALTLGESSIGLSFMVSPHPSYPPLEMSHYGIFVLTNEYDNKNLSLWHDNLISIKDVSPENIADTLIKLCQKIEDDPASGWQGQSYIPYYLNSEDNFTFCSNIYQDLKDFKFSTEKSL